MTTYAPPTRDEISGSGSTPSNATARTGFGKLWDYVTSLLGATGTPEDARTALGLGTFATQNYSSPPAIGGTTPNTAAFTTLSASGSSTLTGDLNLSGSGKRINWTSVGTGGGLYMDYGTGAPDFSLAFQAGGPNVLYDTPSGWKHSWAISTVEKMSLTSAVGLSVVGKILHAFDNAYSFGDSSYRATVVYAVTGTINTSDGTLKLKRGGLSSAEIRAWSNVQWCIYQWIDAVEEKGEDVARLHAGTIAQEVEVAFKAEGLDASRYALWCRDDIYQEVVVDDGEDIIDVPVTEIIDQDEIVIENGRPVVKSRAVEVQKTTMAQVIGKDGKPMVDGDGLPVMAAVPVTEKKAVKKTKTVQEKIGTRLGLRYDQCLVFEAAYQRSIAAALNDSVRALIARVETLEGK